jgi:hypothetical protein
MFQELLTHPQEVLNKRNLVYCVRIMSVVARKLKSWHSQLTFYVRSIPNAVFGAPPEGEQVMLETCRGP